MKLNKIGYNKITQIRDDSASILLSQDIKFLNLTEIVKTGFGIKFILFTNLKPDHLFEDIKRLIRISHDIVINA